MRFRFSAAMLLAAVFAATAIAQTPKRRVPQTSSTRTERADMTQLPEQSPAEKRSSREYVRTGRDYRHVRVERAPRLSDGRLDSRSIIVRSARIGRRPVTVLPKRDIADVDVVIRFFRDGNREEGLRAWSRFVSSLREYGDPIDLDDVMYYVAREGCSAQQDPGLRLYAEKLGYVRDSIDRIEAYIDDLASLRDDARRPGGANDYRDINNEWRRASAERDRLRVEEDVLTEEFNRALQASDAYERDFTSMFEGLFHEAELVIRIGADDGPRRRPTRP
ncbi:MAG: hypothetical protein KDA32_08935 [Phycisphaerales bacterium]|nr:hypothetical protein [Phycisphaerales bacterium]